MKKHLLFLLLCLFSVSAKAQLTGWQYALPITITNSGGALVDYQISLTINTAQYVTAGQMLANGNDIRFGSPCGTTMYSYYIQSGINTATTTIWVKIPSLAAGSTTLMYMFYGNNAATAASTLSIFAGPFSSTNQVASGAAGGVANCQRGFRFSPNQDILMTSLGKREPTGTTRYVTLFNFTTQNVIVQGQVSGPAATYSYAALTTPIWLTTGTQYTIQVYSGTGDGYYFGTSSQINPALTYYDMRYCNSCTQNTFPTTTLTNYHYGYPDFEFYTKTSATTPPTYTLGTPATIGTISIVSSAGSTACTNSTVTFTATTNISTPTYVWKKNGSVVGTNSATYSDNGLVTGNIITCEVVDPVFCSTVTSNAITMTMAPGPTANISGTTSICGGQSVTITFTGGPNNTVTYNVNGGASQTLTLNGSGTATITTPQLNVTTTYNLVSVQNTTCTVPVTGSAVVTVSPQPYASVLVTGTNPVCGGQTSAFTISGIPGGTVSYNINGGATQTVTLSGLGLITIPTPPMSSSLTYNLISVTSTLGCFENITGSATANMIPSPTAAISGSTSICPGDNATITINLTGTQPYNFSYTNGTTTTPVTNHTSNTYTFSVSPSTTTNYTMTSLSDANCIASNGSMTGTAIVTANTLPTINTQPASATHCSGNGASFTLNASGTGITYQWLLNGAPLSDIGVYSGSATQTLNISNVTSLNNNSYTVTVSGTCLPSVTSNPAILTENTINTWSGAAGTLWSMPANWSCGTVPTVVTNVVIPNGAVNMPLVDIPTAICSSLSIDAGASVNYMGTVNALEVKNDITATGTFNAASGSVVLSGNAQDIPGGNYRELHITGAGIKTPASSITISNQLELTNGHLILDTNDIVLTQNATIVGGNTSSFVITDNTGQMRRQNMGTGGITAAQLFPIGSNAGSYTPVTITNTGTMDNISARVINSVYDHFNGDIPSGVMQASNVVNKTWLIAEGTPGGSMATIAPQWNLIDELGTFDRNACYVSHYNTASNNWEPGLVGVATGANPYSHNMTNVVNFSPFGVGSQSSPLSLDLLSFTGTQIVNDVLLNWETTNEFNVKNYEIERSSDDGRTFTKIGKKAAIGNDRTGKNRYSYTDAEAFAKDIDQLFYRIKSIERSGKIKYSRIITMTAKNQIAGGPVNIYPNPVKGDKLYITLGQQVNNKLSVSITDISGKVVYNTSFEAGSYNAYSIPVDVSRLLQGVYILSIADEHNEVIDAIKFSKEQ